MGVRCADVLDLLTMRSLKARRIAIAKISTFRSPFSLGSATSHLPIRPFYPGYQILAEVAVGYGPGVRNYRDREMGTYAADCPRRTRERLALTTPVT